MYISVSITIYLLGQYGAIEQVPRVPRVRLKRQRVCTGGGGGVGSRGK